MKSVSLVLGKKATAALLAAFLMAMLIVPTVASVQAAQKPYTQTQTLLEGLTYANVWGVNPAGKVIFTDIRFGDDFNDLLIESLNPSTGAVAILATEENAALDAFCIDSKGNLYCLISRYVSYNPDTLETTFCYEILKLSRTHSGYAPSSELLWTSMGTEIAHEPNYSSTGSMVVDLFGNLYFAIFDYNTMNYRLFRLGAGSSTPVELLQMGTIIALALPQLSPLDPSLYISEKSPDACHLYRYNTRTGDLTVLNEKPVAENGHMAYLATGVFGDLYYLYRQRADTLEDPWATVEIGHYGSAMRGSPLLQTWVTQYDDDRVWVVQAPLMKVSLTGDVFYSIYVERADWGAATPGTWQMQIVWLNPTTGCQKVIASWQKDIFVGGTSFALDFRGNVYCSDSFGIYKILA